MSDFLRRLVARHTEDPLIRPRAMSRFEAPWAPLRSDREIDDGRSLNVAPANGTAAGVATEGERGPRHVARSSRDEMSDETRPDVRLLGDRALRERPASRSPENEQGTPVTRPVPAATLQASPVDERSSVSPSTDRSAATHRPSPHENGGIPIRPAIRPAISARRSAHDAAAAPREPDVVRVHIGRVEVRAVLPAPERARPVPTRPDGPKPLSLERYLAGERRP
jgi:hypothetical protein